MLKVIHVRKPALIGCAAPLFVGLLLMLMLAPVLQAQVSTADIVGTIKDSTDAVVGGARVTATNLATGLTYQTLSNSRGEFAIPLLPVGHYQIRVEATGFKSWNIADAPLDVGDRFRADAKMEVGALEQSIQVEASAAALQTESAMVGTVVDQSQVKDLPINGRNFIQLAQIVPGANN